MKKLWGFVIFCSIFFGSFLANTQNFAFAAVTQADVTNVINKGTAALTSIPNVDPNLFSTKIYISQLTKIANDTFAARGSDPATTPAALEYYTYMSYISYLTNLRTNANAQNQIYLSAYINAILPLRTQAGSAMSVEAGNATQGQANVVNADAANASAKLAAQMQAKDEEKCSTIFAASQSFTDCIDKFVSWIIKNTFLQLAGFVLWLTANMLNFSVNIGILQFSKWAPDSLYPIWAVIRQIVSLFVVFAGLWLGFMYIIGKGEEFKKYVPWIILFGLFVNFSYPLTRSLIDLSNVISLNVYSSSLGAGALTTPPPGSSQVNGPGAIIVSKMGLSGLIFSATKSTAESKNMLDSINSTPAALMVVVFVAYAAWVFFMATAILVARTAILVFLIVASPILFVDSIIPKLGDEAMKLRKLFFSQLVVAPIFMIMLALTLKFLDIFGSNLQVGNVANIGGPGAVGQFFNVLMMLIMLNITLKVTKSVSGTVGDFATKTIGQVGGFALGAATGGTGLIARQTIGRAALAARDSNWVKNNQDSFLGRRAYNMSNAFATSSFDARNSSFVKTNTDKIGLGMGMGAKLGYEATLENRNKDRMARYDRIETRYKRNVYNEKTGELLHSEGDVNQEGMLAAARFKQKQGRNQASGESFIADKDENAGLKRADRFVFNKKPLGDEFEKITNKEVEDSLTKIMAGFRTNKETGNTRTKEEKGQYIKQIEAELENLKKVDPQLATAQGQALVKGLKQMGEAQERDEIAFRKEVDRVFTEYNATNNEDKKKVLLARQSEEMRQALDERIEREKSGQVVTSQTNGQAPATDTQPQTEQATPSTTWQGQGNTNIPAYQRQAQAGQTPSGARPINVTRNNVASTQTEQVKAPETPVNNYAGAQSATTPFGTTSGFDIRQNNFAQMIRSKKAGPTAPPNPQPTPTTPITPNGTSGVSVTVDQGEKSAANDAKNSVNNAPATTTA